MSDNALVSQRSLVLALGATTFVSAACMWHALRGGGSSTAADGFQADRPQPTVSNCASRDSGSEGLSVNYHFTRQCNYNCGFCFHTAKSSNHVPLEEAKRGLKMLHEAGMVKINFSGGEPFLIEGGRHLGEMCRFCKEVLHLESVTIVSNGSLITGDWFAEYASFVDILAISCDSADDDTNRAIGRVDRKNRDVPHKESLMRVRELCERYGVWFKLNTVVNSKNVNEDMSSLVSALRPKRWKVFQCLLIDGENQGADALRNAASFQISDEAFKEFVAAHDEQLALLGSDVRAVPESNTDMRNSYLILDERMRFLDNRTGAKIPSASILDVGVDAALQFSGFDKEAFLRRGGVYTWTREPQDLSW